jgi:hypothetical protein
MATLEITDSVHCHTLRHPRRPRWRSFLSSLHSFCVMDTRVKRYFQENVFFVLCQDSFKLVKVEKKEICIIKVPSGHFLSFVENLVVTFEDWLKKKISKNFLNFDKTCYVEVSPKTDHLTIVAAEVNIVFPTPSYFHDFCYILENVILTLSSICPNYEKAMYLSVQYLKSLPDKETDEQLAEWESGLCGNLWDILSSCDDISCCVMYVRLHLQSLAACQALNKFTVKWLAQDGNSKKRPPKVITDSFAKEPPRKKCHK